MNIVYCMCLYSNLMSVALEFVANISQNYWTMSIDYVVVVGLAPMLICATVMSVYDFDLAISNFVHWTIVLAFHATYNHASVHRVHMADVDVIVCCVSTFFIDQMNPFFFPLKFCTEQKWPLFCFKINHNLYNSLVYSFTFGFVFNFW